MIALICCLLALSSSAYARSYSGYSSQPAVQPVAPTVQRELAVQNGYGFQTNEPEQRVLPPVSNYGSYGSQKQDTLVPTTRNFVSQREKLLQQQQLLQQKIQESEVVTEADTLCRGQLPEVVIPLDNGRRYVVCITDGKGEEQWCPTGLLYNSELQRCERRGGLQDFCLSQPCLNGGQCTSELSTFKCTCPAGFDGKNCELDARVCQTQRPCGTAPDTRCQSFRFEAALEYICIFRNGKGYGFNAQQIQSNPCTGIDGAQPLLITDKGFIMCDGESMFIESCPGGTTWDRGHVACVWPDMKGYSYDEQLEQGYGQRPVAQHVPKRFFEPKVVEQPRVHSSYGQTVEQPRVLSSYSQTVEQPRVLPQVEQPRVHSSYGQTVEQPKALRPVENSYGYGSQLPEEPVAPKVEPVIPKAQSWQQKMQPQQNWRTVQPQSGY